MSSPPESPPSFPTLPQAILLGAALIAVAVYFGLRAQAPAVVSSPDASRAPLSARAIPGATSSPDVIPPSAGAQRRPEVPAPGWEPQPEYYTTAKEQITDALAKKRAELAKKCFEGLKKGDKVSRAFSFVYNVDPEGVSTLRAVRDSADPPSESVEACIQGALGEKLTVKAPGGRVGIVAELTLP
jgi:hypothetical protein